MGKLHGLVHFGQAHRSTILAYCIVLIAFAASYLGVLATQPLLVPDSRYYLGMAYWLGGVDMATATELVNAATNVSSPGSGLDSDQLFGSGVVQPRVMFPLLSVPFVWLFGVTGLAITAAIISVALVALLTRMLSKRYGMVPAVATMILTASSLFIVWFSTAMLTESLSALWGAVLLLLAWRYQKNPSRILVVMLIMTTLLAAFTRQSTFIPAGAFAVAWVMSVILRQRDGRWGVPALAVCVTTALAQIGQGLVFAPVDLSNARVELTAPTNLLESITYYARIAKDILTRDFLSFAGSDHALLIIIGLSLISVVIFWRRSESHLLVGAILGLTIYNLGNGVPTAFRYAIPGLVFFLVPIALLFNRLLPPSEKTSDLQNPRLLDSDSS